MRLEFSSDVSLLEQRLRVANAKQPGRKHHKRKGAKALEREKATNRRRVKYESAQFTKYKARVAAYRQGSLDTYPTPCTRTK